jgi:ring-1,2-phenylacetyl-CoA epoxidase subunit PaaC
MIRLGDGTDESHDRAQGALDDLWRYTAEMFDGEAAAYRSDWDGIVAGVVEEATLHLPDDPFQRRGGREGLHTEHLGFILAEMQWMQRSHPGMSW